jgi:hypothetical protein
VEKFLEFYENHFEIGKGGYGGVHKGFDKRDNSFVAIKIMPLESGQYFKNQVPILHEL